MPTEPHTKVSKISRALISVSDKTGMVGLARRLADLGVEILSTGGSAKALQAAGIAVIEVGDYTGFPEMMDGRVKTLHPRIHGGILQRRDKASHIEAARQHNIPPIDLVVVNLYPFRATVESGADFATCVENIDIGGPSLVRAAAKNHADVAVLTDPAQYDDFLAELAAHNGSTTQTFRQQLAAEAYAHTAAYDAAIAAWFARQQGGEYPHTLTVTAKLQQRLRYGENPHQTAAFYVTDSDKRPGIASAIQAQGKELSYNNLNDTNAAFETVAEFTDKPAIAIIKHANPCGVATGASLVEAWHKALMCDSVSAFGGIIACNRPLDGAAAAEMVKIFSEVIIAPDMDDEARDILATKKNLRVLLTGSMPDPTAVGRFMVSTAGGFLLQSRDNAVFTDGGAAALKCVTRRQPTPSEMRDMIFAFTIAKHVKSNTIVYARDEATVGIGAGQMSRVDSARIAARKAEDAAHVAGLAEPLTRGCVVASDAFFPFADGLLATIEAGATAVIQPGGSIRDADIIAAADEAGIAMVFTGMRHFYH